MKFNNVVEFSYLNLKQTGIILLFHIQKIYYHNRSILIC